MIQAVQTDATSVYRGRKTESEKFRTDCTSFCGCFDFQTSKTSSILYNHYISFDLRAWKKTDSQQHQRRSLCQFENPILLTLVFQSLIILLPPSPRINQSPFPSPILTKPMKHFYSFPRRRIFSFKHIFLQFS